MHRSLIIFRREWKELRKNKTFFQTLALFPLLMVAMPVGIVLFFTAFVTDFAEKNRGDFVQSAGVLNGSDNPTLLAGLIVICFSFFLPIPAVLPMTVASYSVVNEKERRSLEPLLATPIKTSELLLGKTLSAIVPTCLVCWGCFALLLGLLYLFTKPGVMAKVDVPLWVATIGLWTPVLSAWTTLVGVSISSRAKDARAATQLGSLMVLPLIALVVGIVLGILTISWLLFLAGLLVELGLVLITYSIALRVFERENILTRWT